MAHRRWKADRPLPSLRPQPPGRAGRLLLLIGAGAAVGIAAGFQVAAVIDRAGFATPSPVAAPAPVAAGEKPREHDRLMGGTLAAAMRADEPTDCLTLEPRHRSGCRDYVADLARQPVMVASPPGAEANGAAAGNAATDWPAALD